MDRTRTSIGRQRSHRRLLLAAVLLIAACRREPLKSAQPGSVADENPPTRATVCGTTQRLDRGDEAGDWAAELPATASNTAHFLAFGDSGTGEPSQFRVAAAMVTYCQSHKCEFAIHTGDIFYPQGIGSTSDPRLKERFEGPYAPLGIPIWLTLGNHDYYPPADPSFAVAYTRVSPSKAWRMPARYYTFVERGIRFLALDTSVPDAKQEAWALQVLTQNTERWVIAFGHHPRLSDSRHGDADSDLAGFLDRLLCHRVDLLISGHDHALEVMKPRCGVHQLVTGAGGAALYDILPTEAGTFLAHSFGFVHLETTATTMHARFIDDAGRELCETSWRKAESPPVCGADHTCNGACPGDPDCQTENCTFDGHCNFACTADRDCDALGACACDRDPLVCNVRVPGSADVCGCDAGCQVRPVACTTDTVCDSGCPSGRDPDCR